MQKLLSQIPISSQQNILMLTFSMNFAQLDNFGETKMQRFLAD